MEAKISNSIHNADIRRTSESFSNLPQNLRIICKSEETIWVNKFMLSFHSPIICTFINETNHMADVLHLPDFSSFVVNLLLNVINAGFSKSSVNIDEVSKIDEVFECAKILQINVKQSNSFIDFNDVINGTDVIEVQNDSTDYFELLTESEECTSSSNMYIKEEFKDGKNIKKELQENVDIKKEINIKQESIKQELKDYWGIQEETYEDTNGDNDSDTFDMELCSEYVEFGDTSTELEQFQQTPQSSTEPELRPQILYHTNQIQLPLQQLLVSENAVGQPTNISSATEEDPKNVNEPVLVTSESDRLLLEDHISSATEEDPKNLNKAVSVTSETDTLLLEANLMHETISIGPVEQTVLSTNMTNQHQSESGHVSQEEVSSKEQNFTDEPSELENLLEELSTEIGRDIEEETLNDNSASTSQVFPSYVEQIQQLETSLEEISETEDPKQQIKQQSEDVEGIDSVLTNIKSKLMEMSVKEIKKEINVYPQEIQVPVNLINNFKIEPTQELQECEQSSILDVSSNVTDGVADDAKDKCDVQNERLNKKGIKRKRNEELLTLEYSNNELPKQYYKHQRKGDKNKDFRKSIPTKSKINNFNPTFSGKLQNFTIQKGIALDGYELERSKINLEKDTLKDILTEVMGKTTKNVLDKKVKDVKEFQCQLCSFEYDELSWAQRHYIIEHFRVDLLQYCNRIEHKCLICGAKAFNKTFEIVTHLVLMHDQLNVILKEKGLEPLSTNKIQQVENIPVNTESGEETVKQAQNDDVLKNGMQKTELNDVLTVQKRKSINIRQKELSNKRRPKLLGNENKQNAEITIDVDDLFDRYDENNIKENSLQEMVAPKNSNAFSKEKTSPLKGALNLTKEENAKAKIDELVMKGIKGMVDMEQEKEKLKETMKKKSNRMKLKECAIGEKLNLPVLNTNMSTVENTTRAEEIKSGINQNGYRRKKFKTSIERKSIALKENTTRAESAKEIESFNKSFNKNIVDVGAKVESPTMNDLLENLKYKKDKSEKIADFGNNLTLNDKKEEDVTKEYKVKNIVSKIKFISSNKGALKCEACSKNYSTSIELEEHICETAGAKTIANNSQEIGEEKGNDIKEINSSFQCSICSKRFRNAMFLSIHSTLCF